MGTVTRVGLGAAVAIVATVAIAQVVRDRNPASPGDRGGGEFRTPVDTAPPIARQQPLRVDSFVVQRVAGNSALGGPGDLLVTFLGRGFTLTAKAPRVVLTQSLALESTEINRAGTELYVLVPRNLVTRIEGMRFDSVIVANPGAAQGSEFGRIAVRATAAQLMRPRPDAPAVRLVYRDGAFSRESVRQ